MKNMPLNRFSLYMSLLGLPSSRAEHLFESRNLWSNPADRLNRDTIVVYQDRNNPKKYFMDLSFLDS